MSHYQSNRNTSAVSQQDIELTILQNARDFAARYGVNQKNVRPCIASLVCRGICQNKKETESAAFALVRELLSIGLPAEQVEKATLEFRSQSAQKIRPAELKGKIRRISKGPIYRPTCNNKLLISYCVGSQCYWAKANRKKRFRVPVSLRNEFYLTAWPRLIGAYKSHIWHGLESLRQEKKRDPNELLIFTFSQLGKETGCSQGGFHSCLEGLEEFGLIENLEFGKANTRGKATRLKLVYPFPQPSARHFGNSFIT